MFKFNTVIENAGRGTKTKRAPLEQSRGYKQVSPHESKTTAKKRRQHINKVIEEDENEMVKGRIEYHARW